MNKLILFFFTILFPMILSSNTIKYNIKENVTISNLAKSSIWKKLLYFDKKSEILTNEYFLSKKENLTLENELIKTINSYKLKNSNNFNNNPICKFPARYYWLSKYIDFPNYEMINNKCKDLKKWSLIKDTQSISAILVSGYLGNPASTFGHSFLKINTKNKENVNNLFDLSINYGALVPENENILKYIFKGIIGGYEAGFSDKYFYTQDLVYSNTEFRDMWEYELNLSIEERNFILLHLWEIIGKKFDYYFLDKNCGYRISQLLDVIVKEPVLKNSKYWYAPVETFHQIEEINDKRSKNNKLLKNINYIPSKQKKIYIHYQRLTTREKTIVKRLKDEKFNLIKSELQKLNPSTQINILDFLIDYYKYLEIKNEDNKKITSLKNKLLLLRLNLPISKKKEIKVENRVTPAKSNKPMILSLGAAYSKNKNFYSQLGFSVFAIESIGKNHLNSDELIVLQTKLGLDNNKEYGFLDSFDLIKIKKLKTSQIDLDEDNLISWKLNIGTKRVEEKDSNIYNSFIKADMGKAFKIKNLTSSFMINSTIQSSYPYLEFMPNIGIDLDFNKLKTAVVYGLKINPYNTEKNDYLKIDTQLNINNTFAISNSFEKDKELQYSINFKWFF
jgi:hypothetical protein